MGFGWVIRFIGLLQIVTESNYSRITCLRSLQSNIARTKFPQPAVSSLVFAW
jgi:hypothetical protein